MFPSSTFHISSKIKIPAMIQCIQNHKTLLISGPLGKAVLKLDNYDLNGVYFLKLLYEPEYTRITVCSKFEGAPKFLPTFTTLVRERVQGVSGGFLLMCDVVGVGYRFQQHPNGIELRMGWSHRHVIKLPFGVQAFVPKSTRVCLFGLQKQTVHHVGALLKQCKPPEPYKGKGIRWKGEIIMRKEGKKK